MIRPQMMSASLARMKAPTPAPTTTPENRNPLRQIHPTQFVKRGVGQNPADQQANKAKKTSTIFAVLAADGLDQGVFAVVILRCPIRSAATVACSHITKYGYPDFSEDGLRLCRNAALVTSSFFSLLSRRASGCAQPVQPQCVATEIDPPAPTLLREPPCPGRRYRNGPHAA